MAGSCGKTGKELFPNEPTHSAALTYPVGTAIYTIKYINEKPILYGLLRYKHIIKQPALSLNKIKKIGQYLDIRKSPIINASIPNLYENKKHCYCVTDITNIINHIKSTTYYGSDIALFYNHDY